MKAKFGLAKFLELPGTVEATPERVRQWLASLGIQVGRAEWVPVTIAPDLPPRYVNLAYTTRCVDAFLERDGELQGCELKVSGDDGVCGLTLAEERLLRGGHTRIYGVNPVRGLIGEMEVEALLSVPRRVDSVPQWGGARLKWQDT